MPSPRDYRKPIAGSSPKSVDVVVIGAGPAGVIAALRVAGKMSVEELALVPFSFPTYANALGRAAIRAAIELDHDGRWVLDHLVTAQEVGIA